jgi:2,4-dienoyl-CoA reductase-like NADH-dependent reductase (Old Yellow Enzyme family)
MSPELEKLLSPAKMAGLALRNRVIKTATFEGMTPEGIPTPQLIEFHRKAAAGGAALTTVGQANVSIDGRNLDNQFYFHERAREPLRRLTDVVHEHGAKVSAQLSHCGFFKMNKPVNSKRALAPSFMFNKLGAPFGRFFADGMTLRDIDNVVADYVRSAAMARDTGFDALEISMSHGYMLSQFISANINKRKDEYGGSLANRMRLPLRIVKAIRAEVGKDFPLMAKINLDDGCRGGIEIADAVQVAKHLEAGGIDAIVTSAGRSPGNTMLMFRGESPIPFMIEQQKSPFMKFFLRHFGKRQFTPMPYHDLFLLGMARELRKAVKCGIVYTGGVSSVQSMETAMLEGFDFVGVGRAMIHDPAMVNRIKENPRYVNGCTHCNQCVALIYDPRGVRCVLNS